MPPVAANPKRNLTGKQRGTHVCVPYNLTKMATLPIIAFHPIIRREGSISALRAAAVRRLRSETRLRAQ